MPQRASKLEESAQKACPETRERKSPEAREAQSASKRPATEQAEVDPSTDAEAGKVEPATFAPAPQCLGLAIAASSPGRRGAGAQVVEEVEGSLGSARRR